MDAQWDFKVVDLSEALLADDKEAITLKLRELAIDGWELVTVVPCVKNGYTVNAFYHFRRMKSERGQAGFIQ